MTYASKTANNGPCGTVKIQDMADRNKPQCRLGSTAKKRRREVDEGREGIMHGYALLKRELLCAHPNRDSLEKTLTPLTLREA